MNSKSEKDYSLIFCLRKIQNNETVLLGDKGTVDIEVMLGFKKRGFGAGKINGFGGKLEKGESMEQCAIRELEEESGLKAKTVERVGFLKFNMYDKILNVHVYKTSDWSGEAVETNEMRPIWFPIAKLPLDQMWPDDKFWLPKVLLENKKLLCRFDYDEDDETILDYEVNEQ